MKYLLDTNIFITSKRVHYPMEVFPSYWKELEHLAKQGDIISIDVVKRELLYYEGEDPFLNDLVTKALPSDFFKDTKTPSILRTIQELISWALNIKDSSGKQFYRTTAIDTFQKDTNADIWLIAYAKDQGHTLVTYEASSPNSRTNIKIPDVCEAYRVPCTTPVEMLKTLKVAI
ncbi:MAG: hypothetical protein CSA97_01070 [Bacteroidetes bacterium]|nr:MAG: hypothetical protein CSA97_01070 [Bacteroidota bacterium]